MLQFITDLLGLFTSKDDFSVLMEEAETLSPRGGLKRVMVNNIIIRAINHLGCTEEGFNSLSDLNKSYVAKERLKNKEFYHLIVSTMGSAFDDTPRRFDAIMDALREE